MIYECTRCGSFDHRPVAGTRLIGTTPVLHRTHECIICGHEEATVEDVTANAQALTKFYKRERRMSWEQRFAYWRAKIWCWEQRGFVVQDVRATITRTESGKIVAITATDSEHRIIKGFWPKEKQNA